MPAVRALRPGSQIGIYPQRLERGADRLERWLESIAGRFHDRWQRRRYSIAYIRAAVERREQELKGLAHAEVAAQLEDLRYRLHREGLADELVFKAFAVTRIMSGFTLGMQHYPNQLLGGWVILNGNMAEMATGEGKSLTATLPAVAAALAGIPVHVITTNEYLAARDAEAFAPLYKAMGLTVAAALESMSSGQRREAYGADIVYLTNQQLVFDYLRDRLASPATAGRLAMKYGDGSAPEELSLRGLCFAILDEADSVLVDEARTPLILSRDHRDETRERIYQTALEIADSLEQDRHFFLKGTDLRFTADGRAAVATATTAMTGLFSGQRHSEFLVRQALVARHVLRRDYHYLVRNDKVEIIDQNTGRVMADRSWQQGLHQMVECKESCPVTGQRETLASISYQRFFRRYLHLGGMSGTLKQVRGELRSTYGLGTFHVPTHRKPRRQHLGYTVYPRAQDKWLAILARVQEVHRSGQPVLVGTCSLYDSDLVGRLFARRRLPHRILNARQDRDEADIVASAGELGRITVATNMAGRGTDIKLGDGVDALGGLHVIAAESNPEFRIDRQLFGRSARQGDPGSCEVIVSSEDRLITDFYPAWLLRRLSRREAAITGWLARLLVWLPQRANSVRFRQQRDELLLVDEKLGKTLAYSGRGD
ncbi:MAG: DEAD/DEAH box helicase [Halieaceae bacterium]|nr:DEAD/DEAH box helicase [Halieaceae bacterium]